MSESFDPLDVQPGYQPIHPGEFLLEDWLKPLGITPYRLAKEIHVPLTRISAILAGRRGITADTARRLERYFGIPASTWLAYQSRYELDRLRMVSIEELEAIAPCPRPDLEGVPTVEEMEDAAREDLAQAA